MNSGRTTRDADPVWMNALAHIQKTDGGLGADSWCAVFVAANRYHVLAKFSVDACSDKPLDKNKDTARISRIK